MCRGGTNVCKGGLRGRNRGTRAEVKGWGVWKRVIEELQGKEVRDGGVPVYLYGRRNLVTLERSSLMKERGNISLDSCAVYLK